MTHWRSNTNVQADLGGNEHPPARHRANTQREPNLTAGNWSLPPGRQQTGREQSGLFYPLPAQSIRDAAAGIDAKFDEREIGAKVFAALILISPLALLVLCLSVIRLFS